MSGMFTVGIVGARGYTGQEIIRLVQAHPFLELSYAATRQGGGSGTSGIVPQIPEECRLESSDPEEIAARPADVVILALPDGAGAPYVEAVGRHAPGRTVIDLSADHRFDRNWAYGLPELGREDIRGAERIANPGCYATAAQLALAPLAGLLAGPPSVFGVSGYSGAGTKPGPRNNPEHLADNLLPYALTGHKHEREISFRLGTGVYFTPHVHPAFRGLMVTVHAPVEGVTDRDGVIAMFRKMYADEPLVDIQDAPPELKDGTGRNGVLIGGISPGADGRNVIVVAVEDNLLKGAAVQAVQNVNLALDLPETAGILAHGPASGNI